jgi:hypothetical protein
VVVKKHIQATINKLDRHYNSAPTTEATFYSKLAIIELCGWIEFCMDNIAQNFASRKLRTTPYQDIFRGLKNKNYGFEYKGNFRKMLYQTIGLHNMEKIEVSINHSGSIAILEAELDILKSLRNDAAHTYIDATKTYQAPSVTKAQLDKIYPILKEFSRQIREVR